MTLLDVQHLQKNYQTRFGAAEVTALKDISFSVEEGEYVAVMGESGSGKTHLLQAIGNKVLENNPEKRVKYISAKDLLENELEIQKVRSALCK